MSTTVTVIVSPTTIIPQGDGSYLVRPGKPMERLTSAQFAAQVGRSASSVRRYIDEGVIPPEMVGRAGLRKYLIHPAAVELVKGLLRARTK